MDNEGEEDRNQWLRLMVVWRGVRAIWGKSVDGNGVRKLPDLGVVLTTMRNHKELGGNVKNNQHKKIGQAVGMNKLGNRVLHLRQSHAGPPMSPGTSRKAGIGVDRRSPSRNAWRTDT